MRQRRALNFGYRTNSTGRDNSYKYICTKHKYTKIAKTKTTKHKRSDKHKRNYGGKSHCPTFIEYRSASQKNQQINIRVKINIK